MEREKLYVALSSSKSLAGLYLFGFTSIIPVSVSRMSAQQKQREIEKIYNEDYQVFMGNCNFK